jgi:hypothetical protein
VFENEANPEELRIDHYATAHVLSMHRPQQVREVFFIFFYFFFLPSSSL